MKQSFSFFSLLMICTISIDKSLPKEVLEDLDHSENVLNPFYDDLKKTHDELRAKLSKGKE